MSLKDILIDHEGVKLKVYYDTRGIATIGCGRNLEDVGITYEEAMYLLNNDLKRVMNECLHEFPWYVDLCENRQIVIASMVFNLGLEGFKGFKKMIKAVTLGDWDEAAVQMIDSLWAVQVKAERATKLANMMKYGDAYKATRKGTDA